MKYFIDCEFIEGVQERPLIFKSRLGNWLIGKPKPTIDLISIGIVAEDGREYYAVSKEFNLYEAWNRYDLKINKHFPAGSEYEKVYWIRDNVLKPIWEEKCKEGFSFKDSPMTSYGIQSLFTYQNFKKLINKYGKTNKQIAQDILYFCATEKSIFETDGLGQEVRNRLEDNPVEFYGYYSDYDWVVFCWLFGYMKDLPKGFPMYCIDLKQELDNYITKTWTDVKDSTWGHEGITLKRLKEHKNYPKQTLEHSALHDARFNRDLYNFLKTL